MEQIELCSFSRSQQLKDVFRNKRTFVFFLSFSLLFSFFFLVSASRRTEMIFAQRAPPFRQTAPTPSKVGRRGERASLSPRARWKAPFTFFEGSEWVESGNTKGGCITVPLTSCLTGLESAVWQLTNFVFICKTDQSKPVKQEVNGIVILPPLVFPGWIDAHAGLVLLKNATFTSN